MCTKDEKRKKKIGANMRFARWWWGHFVTMFNADTLTWGCMRYNSFHSHNRAHSHPATHTYTRTHVRNETINFRSSRSLAFGASTEHMPEIIAWLHKCKLNFGDYYYHSVARIRTSTSRYYVSEIGSHTGISQLMCCIKLLHIVQFIRVIIHSSMHVTPSVWQKR